MSTLLKVTFVAGLMLLAGCEPQVTHDYNQCLRSALFKQCLKDVPVGPTTVGHNDWGKVVDMCGDISRDQSRRPIVTIPTECRSY